MKSCIPLILLLSALSLSAQTLPYTQRLYCNLALDYKVSPRVGRDYVHTIRELVTGTCWVVHFKGESLIITAAHNLGLGPNFVPAPLARAKPVALVSAPHLGVLAYMVADVGLPKGNADWIALRPTESRALSCSLTIHLSETPSKVGESVTVIGFPDTAHEQRTERMITSISPANDFIIFNQPLEPGYSGGVVLNTKNQAVGLVVTTDRKQSTALLLSGENLAGLKWRPFKEMQERTVTLQDR